MKKRNTTLFILSLLSSYSAIAQDWWHEVNGVDSYDQEVILEDDQGDNQTFTSDPTVSLNPSTNISAQAPIVIISNGSGDANDWSLLYSDR